MHLEKLSLQSRPREAMDAFLLSSSLCNTIHARVDVVSGLRNWREWEKRRNSAFYTLPRVACREDCSDWLKLELFRTHLRSTRTRRRLWLDATVECPLITPRTKWHSWPWLRIILTCFRCMPGSASASSHTNLETFFFFFFNLFIYFIIIIFFIIFNYILIFIYWTRKKNTSGASGFRTPNLPIMWPALCPLRHGGTPDTRRLTSEGSDK